MNCEEFYLSHRENWHIYSEMILLPEGKLEIGEPKKIKETKCELYHDNFQNYKRYSIPKAQLVIADIPYNIGINAYASSPSWYKDGDNNNGESEKAGKTFFKTDVDFRIAEYMHFCNKLLIKEPKETNKAPAMIVFCSYQQIQMLIDYGIKYGFNRNYVLYFIKNQSSQALKANMKIVGATETAIVLYRDKLPKYNNNGKMIFNWFNWVKDKNIEKVHPTQKPIIILKRLIEIFTDIGDVVVDPVAGSGTTLRAAYEIGRNAFGFESDKKTYLAAKKKILNKMNVELFQVGKLKSMNQESLYKPIKV